MNKEWKEIEEDERKRNSNMIAEYGFNIEEYAEKNLNRETLKKKRKKMKIAKIIAIFLIILIVFIQFYTFDLKRKAKVRENLLKDMENSYHEKFEIVEEKTFWGGKGFYKMKIANIPQLEIHSVVNEDGIGTDFDSRYYKYYFEKWNDNVKSKFVVNELYEDYTYKGTTMKNWQLSYYTYIEVKNYEELLEATNYIIKFIEYIENRYILLRSYIKFEDKLIIPHCITGESNEEILNNAIKQFKDLKIDNN